MRVFADAVERGDIGGESAVMAAYGVYLMNGGTPSGFAEMTVDDVQIMLTTYLGMQHRLAMRIASEVWSYMERRRDARGEPPDSDHHPQDR